MFSSEDFAADELAVVARLRSRFRGALLGLAIGDALAAPAQYSKPGSFAPVRDLLGGGPFDLAPGTWTDDTALSLLLTQSLIDCKGCDPTDQLERFRRWQREGEGSASGECLGITASVSRALVDGAPAHGVADGADAMVRTAPLVLWHYADEPSLLRDVAVMAGVTSHDVGTLAATTEFAHLLLRAVRGASSEVLFNENLPGIPEAIPGNACAARRLLDEVHTAMQGAKGFREAVLAAVNQGGDADARAAVAGQLAGALFGVESIPASWLATLARREAIEETADALLAEVLVRLEAEG